MQRLEKLVADFKGQSKHPSQEEMENFIREHLQVRALQLLFQSKFGGAFSFMGGTCLRICYDLKRYSEDLDFALDGDKRGYHFTELIDFVQKELQLVGFSLNTNVHEEKTVQKAFLRFQNLYSHFGLKSVKPNQKIHIKIEVDTHPIPLKKEERESFFVARSGEIFPILKHTLPTLFAGKIIAILFRPYARGRDYYDLIWYLSRKTPLNFRYLKAGAQGAKLENGLEVVHALKKKMSEVKPEIILRDMGRFLEDPIESSWISQYSKIFDQLSQNLI